MSKGTLMWNPNFIKKSDAFGGSKITFGEIVTNLVKYGEFSEFGKFRQKSRNGR